MSTNDNNMIKDNTLSLSPVDPMGVVATTETSKANRPPVDPCGCINLQTWLGKRYKLQWEAKGVSRKSWGRADEPWLLELKCKHGLIYPMGGEILQAYTNHSRIGAQLRRLPCIRSARGGGEVVVTFHVDDIDTVLKIMKPKRRRQPTSTQRARLVTTLTRARAKRAEKHCERTRSAA